VREEAQQGNLCSFTFTVGDFMYIKRIIIDQDRLKSILKNLVSDMLEHENTYGHGQLVYIGKVGKLAISIQAEYPESDKEPEDCEPQESDYCVSIEMSGPK
jgi:hypothetical protein